MPTLFRGFLHDARPSSPKETKSKEKEQQSSPFSLTEKKDSSLFPPHLLAGGWKGAKELHVSKFALKEGAKELPGVLQGHGSLSPAKAHACGQAPGTSPSWATCPWRRPPACARRTLGGRCGRPTPSTRGASARGV